MRMRTVLKELNVTREDVINYCRKKYPHLFHKQTFIKIQDWKPNIEDSKSTTIEFCEVRFKTLLLSYLSDHNFPVTGRFASELKGW